MTIRAFTLISAAGLMALLSSCRDQSSTDSIVVPLKNTDTYEHATVGGDEEQASIVSQATHYSVSEIRRNRETNWVAVYFYRPSAGYVGNDEVALETRTGSDGSSAPINIRRINLKFRVTN
jgi:hypothetical protein